ncbi:hypothetical protein GCM10009104_18900 [Marinobacterium maritimum]|uniref:Uncharacterized protein n=1 Tax=Marinobacterium maritimum TaxID=500162 RepID=A0ABP3TEA5_9GAMM
MEKVAGHVAVLREGYKEASAAGPGRSTAGHFIKKAYRRAELLTICAIPYGVFDYLINLI